VLPPCPPPPTPTTRLFMTPWICSISPPNSQPFLVPYYCLAQTPPASHQPLSPPPPASPLSPSPLLTHHMLLCRPYSGEIFSNPWTESTSPTPLLSSIPNANLIWHYSFPTVKLHGAARYFPVCLSSSRIGLSPTITLHSNVHPLHRTMPQP